MLTAVYAWCFAIGCLVSWHDSRLGCERSRVQFPEQPFLDAHSRETCEQMYIPMAHPHAEQYAFPYVMHGSVFEKSREKHTGSLLDRLRK